MKTLFKLVGITYVVVLFTGCAGSDFKRVDSSALVLGETNYQEVRKSMGKPYQEGNTLSNEKQVKTSTYAYASTGGKSSSKGVTAARSQAFYFYNNLLVGHEYTSSWAVDKTDFDQSKIELIKKGETTIAEVETLLGLPTSEYIYPVIASKEDKAIGYLYSHTKGSAFNLSFYQENLVITYNKDLIVTDVTFTSSGEN